MYNSCPLLLSFSPAHLFFLFSVKFQAYIPGVSRPLKEGEEWEFDPEAYRLFHAFNTSELLY